MQIITTSDGSHTLYSAQFNEIYHSRHGAIQESKHVFIRHGLQYQVDKGLAEINIFEVGFGTGLNAILTLMEAQKADVNINYQTIELYPVPIDVIKELNYSVLLDNEKYRPPYHSMHLCTWNEQHSITPAFQFKKIQGSLFDSEMPAGNCHLIYFDAFAPEHQPEMWTLGVMQLMYNVLAPNGVLVSYCSKSLFQRALKQAGFFVEKLPGPPGKREMIRALKPM